MEDVALEALHVAARAISLLGGIKHASADNDHDSGEVAFTTETGRGYIMRFEEVEIED